MGCRRCGVSCCPWLNSLVESYELEECIELECLLYFMTVSTDGMPFLMPVVLLKVLSTFFIVMSSQSNSQENI